VENTLIIRGQVDQYIDRVPTEKTIFNLLVRDKHKISDKYELIMRPLGWWLNKKGIPATNKMISGIKSDGTRVFLCQHISVDQLKFRNSDIVFTPHATTNNKHKALPFYAVSVDKSLISDEREFEFSFLGSIATHNIRKKLVKLYPRNCFDSHVYWGIEQKDNKKFVNRYIKMLGNTKFGICPRGTGPGSIRMFEVMAMGSIPVVIADGYKFPLDSIIDWGKISISVKEKDIGNIADILKQYDYETMRNAMSKIYDRYFKNDVLHETVINVLS